MNDTSFIELSSGRKVLLVCQSKLRIDAALNNIELVTICYQDTREHVTIPAYEFSSNTYTPSVG